MGTVAAPLLAGFALATLAFLTTSGSLPPFGEVAIVAFAAGAALFVFCLQFTNTGLLYSASASDRMAWIDDDPDRSQRAKGVQRLDQRLQDRYFFRARFTYDLGILCHLVGLSALVAPRHLLSQRTIGFAIVVGAIVLELVWIVGGWTGLRPRWLLPGYRDVAVRPENAGRW